MTRLHLGLGCSGRWRWPPSARRWSPTCWGSIPSRRTSLHGSNRPRRPSARHRRPRAGYPIAVALWRAGVARGRAGGGAGRGGHRHRGRRIRGLAWGLADALIMRLADFMLALPALPLLVLLAAADPSRIGLPGRGEAAGMCCASSSSWPSSAGLGWRGWRARRPWRRCRATISAPPARSGQRSAHPAPPCPAGAALAGGGRHRAGGRRGDPRRIDVVLPRPGHQPAGAVLGQHARQCAGTGVQRPLGGGLAGLAIMTTVAACTLVADGLRRR